MKTEDLKKILDEPRGVLIAVDMDGVLCDGKFWEEECAPRQDMIDKVWEWYKKGAHIIVYTGRQPKYYPLTQAWLMRHEVPFHGIAMQQKIGAAVYIDDRAVNMHDL